MADPASPADGAATPNSDAVGGDGPAAAVRAAVEELQVRLTYQEDEIHHLNRVLEAQRTTLESQSRQIDELRRLVVSMAEAMRERITDGKPPHY